MGNHGLYAPSTFSDGSRHVIVMPKTPRLPPRVDGRSQSLSVLFPRIFWNCGLWGHTSVNDRRLSVLEQAGRLQVVAGYELPCRPCGCEVAILVRAPTNVLTYYRTIDQPARHNTPRIGRALQLHLLRGHGIDNNYKCRPSAASNLITKQPFLRIHKRKARKPL
ncbi:hypothetical protein MPH_10216 [Macrophomina phaseolina MS6]|uniref:Uncharacterized protein n=1 Tax=Macrophomina phaseolina (strain MS6) TaxID=1126212 RepID=K2RII2_MACPH|nr:hypothetical protein MPH_10216 [Macrophomina phaseolina MS6]